MQFIIGISFFLLGIHFLSHNLQLVSSGLLKTFFSKNSKFHAINFLWGIVITLILQSSNAVVAMLMSVSSNKIVKLRVILSLLLGSVLASALIVKILSFNIFEYGSLILVLGFFLRYVTQGKVSSGKLLVNQVGNVVMGLGFILYGLSFIFTATENFQDSVIIQNLLLEAQSFPLVFFLLCMIFTALLHSSTAMLVIIIAFATSLNLPLNMAFWGVLGANIGSALPTLLHSFNTNSYRQQRVAFANTFVRIISCLCILPFWSWCLDFLPVLNSQVSHQVSNFFLITSMLGTFIVFTTLPYFAYFIKKIIPAKKTNFSTKYLVKDFEKEASLLSLVARAEREILRMSEYTYKEVKDSIKLFDDSSSSRSLEQISEKITQRDSKIDHLHREIQLYLAELLKFSESQSERKKLLYLSSFVADLESVGDLVDNSLCRIAFKQKSLMITFGEMTLKDLCQVYEKSLEVSKLSIDCFMKESSELAEAVIESKHSFRELNVEVKERYMMRLVNATGEQIKNATLFMDVLEIYREIVSLMCRHTYFYKKEENFEDEEKAKEDDTSSVFDFDKK